MSGSPSSWPVVRAALRGGRRRRAASSGSTSTSTPATAPTSSGSFQIVDLFSGAGGCLKAATQVVRGRPVAYCDIDEGSQRCLHRAMALGHLPKAPVYRDVRAYRPPKKQGAEFMVVGGSPCQDMSTFGKREGIVEGERSSLFFELMRVARECNALAVFVENVVGMRTAGLDAALRQFDEDGYDVRWCAHSASDEGAPHQRRRLYMLAVRRDALRGAMSGGGKAPRAAKKTWWQENAPPPRILPAGQVDSRAEKEALKLCGNGVVVPAVVSAMRYLATGTHAPGCRDRYKPMELLAHWKASERAFDGGHELDLRHAHPPMHGVLLDGAVQASSQPPFRPVPRGRLVYVPPTDEFPRDKHGQPIIYNGSGRRSGHVNDLNWDERVLTLGVVNTPRAGMGATVQVAPTHRAERDLPHQLAFLSDTDPKMRKLAIAGRARINPHFVAWMMGYERGWIMPDEDLTETTGVQGEWAWLHEN